MNMKLKWLTLVKLAAFISLIGPMVAHAVPISYTLDLEDGSGNAVYTGNLTVDSSRLQPNLFTAFDDSGFISLSITIGTESWTLADAYNPSTEGVIADGLGALVSFHDDTDQQVALLINGNGKRLDILENNGWWSTTADVLVTSGASHSITRLTMVPEPASLALLGLGLVGLVYSRKRKPS